jgi:hypothetical protein
MSDERGGGVERARFAWCLAVDLTLRETDRDPVFEEAERDLRLPGGFRAAVRDFAGRLALAIARPLAFHRPRMKSRSSSAMLI